jgi:hypothetical protein
MSTRGRRPGRNPAAAAISMMMTVTTRGRPRYAGVQPEQLVALTGPGRAAAVVVTVDTDWPTVVRVEPQAKFKFSVRLVQRPLRGSAGLPRYAPTTPAGRRRRRAPGGATAVAAVRSGIHGTLSGGRSLCERLGGGYCHRSLRLQSWTACDSEERPPCRPLSFDWAGRPGTE